jgi:polyisoprenyl-phosphate glycosyltransferase
MKYNAQLSIVVPVYNEQEIIEQLVQRLVDTASAITPHYEIIFVNDGSRDSSLLKLKEACDLNPHLRYISFSRNFGHQVAITAGMDYTTGEVIVTIDGDLQDPPELILDMYADYQAGNKVVYAKRSKRNGETYFKLITAKLFYRFMTKLVAFEIPQDVGDFRLITRDVLQYLKKMEEPNKYIRGQIAWLGFKSSCVYYERDKRTSGSSNYPLKKMINLAINGVTAFSDSPLKVAAKLGFAVCFFSFCVIAYALYGYFVGHTVIPGWASTIITITFLGGVQLLSLGILGEYISRINDSVRKRPLYVIDQINIEK